MKIKLKALAEKARGNLFFVPMLYVVAGVVIAELSIWADQEMGRRGIQFPELLRATVDSGRAMLGTVAGATITFAGIAFSVSLLTIQLASSQFSPRVLYGFYRDRTAKTVMGIAVGTFAFCLIVLRAVRGPLDENGSTIIPNLSLMLAVVFGVVAVLSIVVFINHSAHSMEVGEIVRRISEETRSQIVKLCPDRAGESPPPPVIGPLPEGPPLIVRAHTDGWVQQVDTRKLAMSAPPAGIVRLAAGAGMFVAQGTELCRIWPKPENEKEAGNDARRAVHLGRTRTMQQDMALGFRQLVDIALRALSPGVNDPTTAHECVVHIGSILRELLLRDLPARVHLYDGERRIFRPEDFTHADYVGLAFNQIRRASAGEPALSIILLRTFGMLVREAIGAGLDERAAYVRAEADLVLEAANDAGLEEADLLRIRRAAEEAGLAPRANGGAA